MKTRQTAVIIGANFLAVIAILAGDFLIHRSHEIRGNQPTLGVNRLVKPAPFRSLRSSNVVGETASNVGVQPGHPPSGRNTIHGDTVAIVSSSQIRARARTLSMSDRIRLTERIPLIHSHETAGEPTILRLIEHELPAATTEEREVWFNKLKCLMLGGICDVLRTRRRFRPILPSGIIRASANEPSKPLVEPYRVIKLTAPPYQSRPRTVSQFQSALAGLWLAQDVVANNIANANTVGFKRSRTMFEDLSYKYRKLPGAQDEQGNLSPIGLHVGLGNCVAGTEVDHSEGKLLETGKTLDLAIVGDGFSRFRTMTRSFRPEQERSQKMPTGRLCWHRPIAIDCWNRPSPSRRT